MAQEPRDPTPTTVVTTSPELQLLQPPWIGEAALVLQVGEKTSIAQGITDLVRVPRGHAGTYEACDFFLVLVLYAVSRVANLEDFHTALLPWGPPLAALWLRSKVPSRSALSRFLEVVPASAVEVLRNLLFDDLLAHGLREKLLGSLQDREGNAHLLFDVDGKKQAARQRAIIEDKAHPPLWRRLAILLERGYLGRKRGEAVRTRTTLQQAHTHESMGTWGAAGNGKAFEDLAKACECVKRYLSAHVWTVASGVLRLDGLYGVVPAVAIIATAGLGWLVRTNDRRLWKRPEVIRAMAAPAEATFAQPDTGTVREVIDVGWIDWAGAKGSSLSVRTRLVLTRHTLRPGEKRKVGLLVGKIVYELFATDRSAPGWHAVDVVDLYFARGGFEQTLSEEDKEQDLDRWSSGHPHGQECWQLLSQWVWNVRLRLGVAAMAPEPRVTLWSPAFPLPHNDNHGGSVTLPAQPPVPACTDTAPSVSASPDTAPATNATGHQECSAAHGEVAEAAGRGAGKYGGRDFGWTPSGDLECPAGIVLRPWTRRLEGDHWRVIYVAPAAQCAVCVKAPRCRGAGAKPRCGRRVSVFVPTKPSRPVTPPAASVPTPQIPTQSIEDLFRLPCSSSPLLWTDVPATTLRNVLRVEVQGQCVDPVPAVLAPQRLWLSRAQRAHRRLSWAQRVARNAHPPFTQPWRLHLHGIPTGVASYIENLRRKPSAA